MGEQNQKQTPTAIDVVNRSKIAERRDETSLKARGLSPNIPKPNMVRIEVLDGDARMRYLGYLQKIGDDVKTQLYNKSIADTDKVFFGFLKSSEGTQNLSINAEWEDLPGVANILGNVKSFVNSAVAGGKDVVGGVAEIGRRLTGINASATGSGSLQKFKKTSLNEFTVECGWYLPEQYNLCVKSLRTLMRMTYPRQVPDENLNKVLNDSATKKKTNDAKAQEDSDPKNKAASQVEAEPSPGITSRGLDSLIKATGSIGGLFGRNLSFDPLPVRLSVGQYLDMEPLVIKEINVNVSKETFVLRTGGKERHGRHIPIFCTVSIQFAFWMRPSPKLDFLSIMGEEMFGSSPPKVTIEKDSPIKTANLVDTTLSDTTGTQLNAAINRSGRRLSLEELRRNIENPGGGLSGGVRGDIG